MIRTKSHEVFNTAQVEKQGEFERIFGFSFRFFSVFSMFFGQAVPTISTGHRHRENLGGSILHAERRTLFDRGGRGALEWAESGVEEESTPWELENKKPQKNWKNTYRSLHLKDEFDMYFIDSF